MLIKNPAYLKELRAFKQAYADLPWYQRFWFSLWSYNLSSALSAIELDNPENQPTSEQIQALYEASTKAWFFDSIFGLLEQFKKAVVEIFFFNESAFTQLPSALDSEIGHDLTTQELIHLVQSSKTQKALFQPVLDVRQFLHHVTRGNYDEMERMLRKDPTFLTRKGSIIDCSGRAFSNISGAEYLFWALDKHGWTRAINCLPHDEQGVNIKTTLAAQYKKIKDQGIIYSVNGKPIATPEHHFDFQNTIIKELQTQVGLAADAANAPNPDWDAVDKQWREGVGSAQKKLPMHVVYEYCSEEPFFPKPTFAVQPTLKKQFYNWITTLDENWFHSGSKLGSDFAIYRGGAGGCEGGAWGHGLAAGAAWGARLGADLEAIRALCEVRTKDFNDLEVQLGSRPDNTPDPAPQM